MTQMEKETVELFCRELALALKRITGKVIEINPASLAAPAQKPLGINESEEANHVQQEEDDA